MIFTRNFVTRENHWQIASLVTQKSLFTVTHALFFIIFSVSENKFRSTRINEPWRYDIDWKENTVILNKFPTLAAPEVVKATTSGAANDENLLNMTFLFQCSSLLELRSDACSTCSHLLAATLPIATTCMNYADALCPTCTAHGTVDAPVSES